MPPHITKSPVWRSMVGRRFGRLRVKAYAGQDKWGKTCWCCECDCGTRVTVPGRRLLAQDGKHKQVSCGCARRDPMVRWQARMKVPPKKRVAICKKMRAAVREHPGPFKLDAHHAAELLGVSLERVEILAQDGALRCVRRRGALYVSSEDVSSLLSMQCEERKRCASREARDIGKIAQASARRTAL